MKDFFRRALKLVRRVFCRHKNMEAWRKPFHSEIKPYEDAEVYWCRDCDRVVLKKEKRP